MDFCKLCDNMYYIKLVNETCDNITYYCRKCGNEDKDLINTSKSIVKEHISSSVENKINFVNKYTKFDITLPRINYIKCPNSSCISNAESFNNEDKEITNNNSIDVKDWLCYDENNNLKNIKDKNECDKSLGDYLIPIKRDVIVSTEGFKNNKKCRNKEIITIVLIVIIIMFILFRNN